MFKKQPGTIRVIIPGCSQRKGGSRRVMRQLVNAAQSLESRVADKHNINVLRATLHGTQLWYLRSTALPFGGINSRLVKYTCDSRTDFFSGECACCLLAALPFVTAICMSPFEEKASWCFRAKLETVRIVLPVATSHLLKDDIEPGGR